MADYTVVARPMAVNMVTEDVSAAHTIYNRSGSVFMAGILVRINRGDSLQEHLDTDTIVEVRPGSSATIDPTAYSGTPAGVGVTFRSDAIDSTASEMMIRDGNITTFETGSKPKAKTKAKK